jgi:hypothetical protein
MRFLRCGAVACAAATASSAVLAAAAAGGDPGVSIRLTRTLPDLIRVNQRVTVAGQVRGAQPGAQVAVELKRDAGWRQTAAKSLGASGRFQLTWTVRGRAYIQAMWRVIATGPGTSPAATPPRNVAIGPAAVYCKAPVPPAVDIPVGDGWIVGGLYGEGGPFPGIYACSSSPYTVTATDRAGRAVASQHVAGLHSYTLVVPAGAYTLTSNGCRGTATVKAGKQTKANTYCLYP